MPSAWCELFRLPNLPSAPGDALAGAALIWLLRAPGGAPGAARPGAVAAAASAALFLYMAGLAQNDLLDARRDRSDAPGRPIPSGRIPPRAARAACAACFAAAPAAGAAAGLPPLWFAGILLLAAAVSAYNVWKNRLPRFGALLMGGCRGLSFLCGAAAAAPRPGDLPPALLAAAGWTAYVAAVTLLALDEHRAAAPLPRARFLPGLAALIPAACLPFLPSPPPPAALCILPLGCAFACAAWCRAVAGLGRPHTPADRGRAVGRAVGALLYLQGGFAFAAAAEPVFPAGLALCFAARLFIRRRFPGITGS